MAERSKIEWTESTWNPWLGCTKISAGCDHCYAAELARRRAALGWPAYEVDVPRKRTSAQNWRLPARWNRKAAANGVRVPVFPSLCDPFDVEAPAAWCFDLLDQIEATPWLDWLLLTKRPKVAAQRLATRYPEKRPVNLALGVSIEDQKAADLRVPQLLEIPGLAMRFVSAEPLLGPVNLLPWLDPTGACCGGEPEYKCTACPATAAWRYSGEATAESLNEPQLDWIIAGGESGPRSRPSRQIWHTSLRDQCVAAGVPFFFKQLGDWAPSWIVGARVPGESRWVGDDDRHGEYMHRVGKLAAGAELDGRTWRQLPAWLERKAAT